MKTVLRFTALMVCALMVTLRAFADSAAMQSDWLDLVKGAREETLGVELISIEDDATPGMTKVMLAVPKASVGAMDTIEEVVVVGQRPERPAPPAPLDISYEWVEDYDNDNYGLLIHISKDTVWPIRLYVNSESGFVR